MEILRLFASDWNELFRQLDALSSLVRYNATAVDALTSGPKEAVLKPLRDIERLCRFLGLKESGKYATRLVGGIERTPLFVELGIGVGDRNFLKPKEVETQVAILPERIDDELASVELFLIDPGKYVYLTGPYLFTVEVSTRFPEASDDIEEAGKCFAYDRHTACVFHLMRVMEVGLRWLGSRLNDPSLDPKTNPNWDRILSRCDKELQKPYAQRSPDWNTDPEFFADATANLRAVKDAWRNPTLHVERDYDEEKAREIWNAVRAFMRHLATKAAA